MADRKVVGTFLAWGIVLGLGLILITATWRAAGLGKELNYNELTAIRALRLIAAAQQAVLEEDPDGNGERDYWIADLSSLAAWKSEAGGKPAPLLSSGIARSDPRPLVKPARKPEPFCGYHYAALREAPPADGEPRTNPARFAFCAWPAEYGRSGRETYLVDQRGKVHAYDGRGLPPVAWPPQAEPVTRIVDD